MRCNQDETLASPRKFRRLRNAARNVSCVASRASSSRPSIPNASAKIRRSQRRTISPNASGSPDRASSTIRSSFVAVSTWIRACFRQRYQMSRATSRAVNHLDAVPWRQVCKSGAEASTHQRNSRSSAGTKAPSPDACGTQRLNISNSSVKSWPKPLTFLKRNH